jgi:hypothetical protein
MATKQKTKVSTMASEKAIDYAAIDLVNTEIAKRAKEIYLKRQKTKAPGDELSDWLLAEKKVKEDILLS